MIEQNKNLKQTYEDDKSLLRQEIEDLKHALAEQDALFEQQFQEVQTKLNNQHLDDLEGLKFHHQNQISSLQLEIENLKTIKC